MIPLRYDVIIRLMKIKKYILVLVVLSLTIASVTHAQTAEDTYADARTCYQRLKADTAKLGDRHAWELCINRFEQVNQKFPSNKRGADALYSAARLRRELYYKLRDPNDIQETLKMYNRVIREYPDSSLADDSLYHVAALRHRPLQEDDRARKALGYLLDNYPHGDMAPKAKRLLASLGGQKKLTKNATTGTARTAAAKVAKREPTPDPKEHFNADVAGPLDKAVLTGVDVQDRADGTTVKLKFTSPVAYTLDYKGQGKRTKSPPKLAVVLSYAQVSKNLAKELSVGSPYLDHIRLRNRIFGSGSKVEFVMPPDASYEVFPKGNEIAVNFKRTDGMSPAAITATGPTESKRTLAKKK